MQINYLLFIMPTLLLFQFRFRCHAIYLTSTELNIWIIIISIPTNFNYKKQFIPLYQENS